MSSFPCFLCHGTVISETNDETRDKYKDVVGMHLSQGSHLCHICCHMLNKLYSFKAMCLKRSLEYPQCPVLFSEKATINLQRSDQDPICLCTDESRDTRLYIRNICLYSNPNSKTYSLNFDDYSKFHEIDREYDGSLVDETKNLENISNKLHSRELKTDFDDNPSNTNATDDLYDDNFRNDDSSECQSQINDNQNIQNSIRTSFGGSFYEINNDNANSPLQAALVEIQIDNLQENYALIKPKVEIEIHCENGGSINENTVLPTQETSTKKVKTKKVKKKSYKKIDLSFKEQKSALEAQRKEKKYIEAQFKCFNCALGFLFKDTYQSHMVRHEESNGQFSCNVCTLRFVTQNARYMHVLLHSELYKCNKCGVRVKRTQRKRHSRECWHVNCDTASCHLCGKEFKDSTCLQQHLRRFHISKTNRRMYSCNVCGKSYPDQGAVRRHMIQHINNRFTCDRCPSTFTSPYTLNQHKKCHDHDTPATEQFACTTCSTSYKTKKSLLAHFRNTLRHQQTSFECPICGRNCPNARGLSSHIESHSATKHYCDICSSAHSSRKSLLRHMRNRHTTQNKIATSVCHLCGATFKRSSKLKRHLKEVCERARLEEELVTYYEQHEDELDIPLHG